MSTTSRAVECARYWLIPETLNIGEQELEGFYYELVRSCHMLSELIQSMTGRATQPEGSKPPSNPFPLPVSVIRFR